LALPNAVCIKKEQSCGTPALLCPVHPNELYHRGRRKKKNLSADENKHKGAFESNTDHDLLMS